MTTRRQLVVIGVGIVVIAVVLSIAARLLPDRPSLDSWTAAPESIDGREVEDAEATCRDLLDFFGSVEDGDALVDRRGDWTLVAITTPGRQRTCVMTEDVVGARYPLLRAMVGGFAGWWSTPSSPGPMPPLTAGGFEALPPKQAETNAGRISYVSGWVGAEVEKVELGNVSGPDIEATVSGGRFVLWYPATESPGDGPDDSFLTYTLTLADGSTREVDADLDDPW